MKERVVHDLRDDHDTERRAGYNLSWGAIFAGVVTFLALFIVFTTIGSAAGLGSLNFTSPNPFSGLGTGSLIWVVLTMLLSFFGSGYVSGLAARRVGVLHGFVTWATNLVVLIVFVAIILSSLLSLAGSAIGAAGSAIGTGADAATTAITEGFSSLQENVNVDGEEVDQQTREILEGTGVEELQPEYIQGQLDEAGNDIQEAGQAVITNPENAEQIASDLAEQLNSRVQNVTQEVDEEAISNSVAQNTDLTGAEADEATQNIVQGLEQAGQTAEQALNSAQEGLEQLPQQLDSAVQQLQQGATDVANVSAGALVGLFVGQVLMAVVSALGGLLGVRTARERWDEDRV